MPTLRSLELPAICAERKADAEALYGLTTLVTLKFCKPSSMMDGSMMDLYDWVLDLSRMTTLTSLILEQPFLHRPEQQVQDLRARAGRTDLDISITRVPRHGVYSVTKRDITRRTVHGADVHVLRRAGARKLGAQRRCVQHHLGRRRQHGISPQVTAHPTPPHTTPDTPPVVANPAHRSLGIPGWEGNGRCALKKKC